MNIYKIHRGIWLLIALAIIIVLSISIVISAPLPIPKGLKSAAIEGQNLLTNPSYTFNNQNSVTLDVDVDTASGYSLTVSGDQVTVTKVNENKYTVECPTSRGVIILNINGPSNGNLSPNLTYFIDVKPYVQKKDIISYEIISLDNNGLILNEQSLSRPINGSFILLVPAKTRKINIYAISNNPDSMLSINDGPWEKRKIRKDISFGSSPTTVKLKNESPLEVSTCNLEFVSTVRSDDPWLSNIIVSADGKRYVLSPAFYKHSLKYVVNDVLPGGKVTIDADNSNFSSSGQKILVSTSSVNDLVPSSPDYRNYSFTFPKGDQVENVYIHTLSADGSTKKTYTVELHGNNQVKSDIKLENLSVTGIDIDPEADYSVFSHIPVYPLNRAFSSDIFYYEATIPNNVSSFRLNVSLNTPGHSMIRISDSKNLPQGYDNPAATSIPIKSPAPNSYKDVYIHTISGTGETGMYQVRVKAQGEVTTNTQLSDLVVKSASGTCHLMPSFDTYTKQYYVCVPNNNEYVYITPISRDSNAKIAVDSYNINNGSSFRFKFNNSSETKKNIPVTISSTDGSVSETYNLVIYRSNRQDEQNIRVDNITLRADGSSNLNHVYLEPDFSDDTTSYVVKMGDSLDRLAFKYEPSNNYSKAFIIYKDNVYELENNFYSDFLTVNPSSSSSEKITVRAFSPDYSNSRDYVFTLSNDYSEANDYLKSLEVMVDGSYVSLSPRFDKDNIRYSLNAKRDSKIIITPTAYDRNSTITVDGKIVRSGSSAVVYLSLTNQAIPIKIVANNNNSRTYYINFNKFDFGFDKPHGKKIKLRLGSPKFSVNDVSGRLAAAPFSSNDRTMVPIRLISEEFGATVDWKEKTKTITIVRGDRVLKMIIGKTSDTLDVPPMTKNGITFVPIRYISEKLGANVEWNEYSQEITITE